MKVKIDIDDKYAETTVIIQANAWSEELAALAAKLNVQEKSKRLVGVENERSVLLEPSEIDCVFAEKRKVMAALGSRNVELRMKLYEVEELLVDRQFMRFSKSVIGNLDQIDHFELVFNGNLCVHFKSGKKEYVSRSYVSELKQRLILGGGHHGA